uniref:hypothetical protein n=1 Tax=Streptomyces hawaiiensis TaxID=67305 RepID=UPI0031D51193
MSQRFPGDAAARQAYDTITTLIVGQGPQVAWPVAHLRSRGEGFATLAYPFPGDCSPPLARRRQRLVLGKRTRNQELLLLLHAALLGATRNRLSAP